MTGKGIRLVTRGDDAGFCHTANMAVLDAFENGILRNASFMVPCAAFDEAAEMFAGLEGFCAGLHVTIVAEWDNLKWGPVLPVEQVPSLVDENGHFFNHATKLHDRGAPLEHIVAEVQAQLDRARARGMDIAYLDEHCSVGWLHEDALREWLTEFCEREGLISSRGASHSVPGRRETGWETPEDMLALLEAAPAGTWLVVGHPGYDTEEMRGLRESREEGERVARVRDGQRRMFTDPRVVQYCAEHGVEPIRYTDI